MVKLKISILAVIRWLLSRVAMIYVILFIFSLTCVDFKMLEMRVKTRHLNDAIPDFSGMISSSKDQNELKKVDWASYQKYFELILTYIPDDMLTEQLLGYVDFNRGEEQKAIGLFKESSVMNGRNLFWSNYNLGVIYYKKGMWSQSAEYLFKTLSSNVQLTVFLMQESIVYRQIFANPYFKYSEKDELNDALSRAYILLLSSLCHLKQFDRVAFVSNIAVNNPNLSYKDAYYFFAGLSFFDEGQYEKSFLLFQKSLSIQKDNPEVYYYIANIYQKAGQPEQAREYLQASYALHQKNDPRFPYENTASLRFF